jgi:hypothetical protein
MELDHLEVVLLLGHLQPPPQVVLLLLQLLNRAHKRVVFYIIAVDPDPH